MRECEPQTK